jgi:hypothetical protein
MLLMLQSHAHADGGEDTFSFPQGMILAVIVYFS